MTSTEDSSDDELEVFSDLTWDTIAVKSLMHAAFHRLPVQDRAVLASLMGTIYQITHCGKPLATRIFSGNGSGFLASQFQPMTPTKSFLISAGAAASSRRDFCVHRFQLPVYTTVNWLGSNTSTTDGENSMGQPDVAVDFARSS